MTLPQMVAAFACRMMHVVYECLGILDTEGLAEVVVRCAAAPLRTLCAHALTPCGMPCRMPCAAVQRQRAGAPGHHRRAHQA